MNTNDILALFDAQERRTAVPPMYIREESDGVVRHVSRRPERLSNVVYSDLTAVTADAAIQAQINRFRALERPRFTWQALDHDAPPDLKARLVDHGFVADELETLLVLETADLPDDFPETWSVDVRRLTTVYEIADVVGVLTAVWDGDFTWLTTQLTDYLTHHPDFISLYAAYVNDEPASCGWSYFPAGSQFVGLWGGATLPAFRGWGLYSALVAARAAEARQRGARFLWVNANDNSRPILQQRGFRPFAVKQGFDWDERGEERGD